MHVTVCFVFEVFNADNVTDNSWNVHCFRTAIVTWIFRSNGAEEGFTY